MDEESRVPLQSLVLDFAGSIGTRLRNVFGAAVPPLRLMVKPSADERAIRVAVTHPKEVKGVDLTVDGQRVLRLSINYRCTFDTTMRFPRVEFSCFQVFGTTSTEPLFRYDYLREPHSDVACAHLNVHGHHDHVVWAMTRSSIVPHSRRRARAVAQGAVPGLRELHFPLGGQRFRPCLEDVLEMLIWEFGVDVEPGWQEELAVGRQEWRRFQLAAAMRDDPVTALQVAEELRSEAAQPRLDRLRQL